MLHCITHLSNRVQISSNNEIISLYKFYYLLITEIRISVLNTRYSSHGRITLIKPIFSDYNIDRKFLIF